MYINKAKYILLSCYYTNQSCYSTTPGWYSTYPLQKTFNLSHSLEFSVKGICSMLCLIILTVSFLTNCGNTSLDVWGLCWMNEDTLVVAAQPTKQLWKLTVNKTARTCEGEVVDLEYHPSDVACSRDGRAFVTEYHSPKDTLSIRIYDMHLREHDVWTAAIKLEQEPPSIAVNDGYIVIGYSSVIYVYNRERVFLYKLNMNFEQESTKRQLYITDFNIFWGAWEDKIVTVNLTSKDMWQYNVAAWGVGGIPHGPVFVTGKIW